MSCKYDRVLLTENKSKTNNLHTDISQKMGSEELTSCSKQLKSNTSKEDHLQENRRLIVQCYRVIQEQEQHIQKLEKDNVRKNTIIENLLSRNQEIKNNKCDIGGDAVEELNSRLQQVTNRLSDTINRNKYYQLEIQTKNQQIYQLNEIIKSLKYCQEHLKNEIEEKKMYGEQLKQKYQTKIKKLLAEFRKKVQDDVLQSQNKAKNQYMQKKGLIQGQESHLCPSVSNVSNICGSKTDQNISYNLSKDSSERSMTRNYHVSSFNPETPIKGLAYGKYQNGEYQGQISNSMTKNKGFEQQKKQIKKTEQAKTTKTVRIDKKINFHPHTNFVIVDQQKQLSHSVNDQAQKQIPSNRKQNSYKKMLKDIKDVEFMTDSYQDSLTQKTPISELKESPQNDANEKQKFLSIQEMLKQVAVLDGKKKQIVNEDHQQKQNKLAGSQYQSQKKINGENCPKKKIGFILEELKQKMERLGNEDIGFIEEG